jgi:predicted phosphoribosyltransferase
MRRYRDRADAGARLAAALDAYAGRDDVLVLALPRGGVPVAAAVAEQLRAPLDILVVRKLGLPGQPELAMGAIAGVAGVVESVRNEHVLAAAGPSDAQFREVYERELTTLRERELAYRGDRAAQPVADRTVIVVDDGLATGATMRAALAAVRRQRPRRIVAAAPVGARRTCDELAQEVDEVVCPWTPEPFYAVGQGYVDFTPTPDEQVVRLLSR